MNELISFNEAPAFAMCANYHFTMNTEYYIEDLLMQLPKK